MLIGCRGLICFFFYYFFASPSPAGEGEQQQLEDGHPGGVRRRRTDRVRPRMPPAGTGSVGTTGNRFKNFRVLHLKEKQRNNPCLSPGVFPGLRVRGRVQQHLRVCAHRRPLCQPAVLRV